MQMPRVRAHCLRIVSTLPKAFQRVRLNDGESVMEGTRAAKTEFCGLGAMVTLSLADDAWFEPQNLVWSVRETILVKSSRGICCAEV